MNARVFGGILLVIALAAVLVVVWMQAPTTGGGVQDISSSPAITARPGESVREPARTNITNPGDKPVRKRDEGAASRSAHTADEPVVIFGKVTIPTNLLLDNLEVELHDAAGELLTSGEVDEKGNYEVRYDRTLLPGWTACTAWVGVTGLEGHALSEPAKLAPSFQKFPAAHKSGEPAIECNLIVGASAVIEGKVVSKSTGAPIPDATVVVLPAMGPWKDTSAEEVETDAEGNFRIEIESLPLRDIFICCKSADDEYQPGMQGPLELRSGETRKIDFTLGAPQKFAGRVVDDATGSPIAGAEVRILPTEYSFAQGFTFDLNLGDEKTNNDGNFEISTASLPIERAIIKVEAEGYAAVSRPATAAALAEIRMTKAVVVQGRVTDESGKPVTNIMILFSLEHEWTWSDLSVSDFVKSDGEGKFVLTLRSTPPDEAFVYVDREPFAPFLAPLKEVQIPGASAGVREIAIKLQLPESHKK